ncbi:WD40 repeat-like protein [Coprinopsis marcescibilis]|uniref:WD40 repeat-like protein n=1 Tax=Coprinopsis marcescibilis TaxID=230819 RepID=A0A5C3L985_COPMA|nr:WD40 repeat-like protein [Coprinopsis marcescibilis]
MAKAAITAKPVEKAAKRARIAVPTKKGPTRGRKGTPPPANRKAVEKAKPSAVASSSKTKIPTKASTTTESEALSKKAKGKKKSIQQEEVPPPSTFKIVAGSYEKLLYGFGGSTSVDKEGKLQFKIKPIFIFPAHVSCIKAVAASPHGGKWLATGSTDEIIKIWDLRRRKEVGSITHLSFPSRSHLLSASEDGSLCLFRARDWTVLRALKGHKGRVNALTVHPSGKVALSVGKDRTMRMWDLMRGKGCASTKLGKEGEAVRWSADGTRIAVQSGSTIDIFSVSMDLLHTIEHPSRLHDVQFCKTVKGDKEVLLAAGENKKLSIYTVPKDVSEEPKIFAEMIGHGNR